MRLSFITLPTGIATIAICISMYAYFAATEVWTGHQLKSEVYPLGSNQALEIFEVTKPPQELIIPSIDVKAAVQAVGFSEKNTGEMAAPSNLTDVAWFKNGVRPGENGSAVIAGHFNGKNTPEAVFYDLKKLEIGDDIYVITENDEKLTFQVVAIETYKYDDPTDSVFLSEGDTAKLNLITCAGDWISDISLYDKRTVVFSELVSITLHD